MALFKEVKCGRCDRRYSALRSRCPHCGARKNRDGKTSTGSNAPDGEYSIKVEGTDVSGAAITVKTEITGKVDGIDFSTTVPTLLIGAIKVPLDKVKSVKSTS